jgi:hypothetical protein
MKNTVSISLQFSEDHIPQKLKKTLLFEEELKMRSKEKNEKLREM